MYKKIKIIALMMALLLVVAVYPGRACAETNGQITVAIMNDTYQTGPWNGTLFTTEVPFESGMTVEQAIRAAFEEEAQSIEWINYGTDTEPMWFVQSVAGLTRINAEEVPEGGMDMSGWMVSVNNWFGMAGLSASLDEGDYVAVEFTTDGGADLNALWGNTDKSLMGLDSVGTLDPAFKPDVFDYVLRLPKGTETIVLHPMPANRNFKTTTVVDGETYSWNQSIPVVDGMEITVTNGDGDQETDLLYTVTIDVEKSGFSTVGLIIAGAMALLLAAVVAVLIVRRKAAK